MFIKINQNINLSWFSSKIFLARLHSFLGTVTKGASSVSPPPPSNFSLRKLYTTYYRRTRSKFISIAGCYYLFFNMDKAVRIAESTFWYILSICCNLLLLCNLQSGQEKSGGAHGRKNDAKNPVANKKVCFVLCQLETYYLLNWNHNVCGVKSCNVIKQFYWRILDSLLPSFHFFPGIADSISRVWRIWRIRKQIGTSTEKPSKNFSDRRNRYG